MGKGINTTVDEGQTPVLVSDHQAAANLPVAHTLRAEGFDASEDGTGRGTPLVPVVAFDTMQVTSAFNGSNPQPGDPCHTLHKRAGDSVIVSPSLRVRRLTPLECERLQGFDDGWTAVPHRGKPASDGRRYHAQGNSWAVPVARWVGERIAAVSSISAEATC